MDMEDSGCMLYRRGGKGGTAVKEERKGKDTRRVIIHTQIQLFISYLPDIPYRSISDKLSQCLYIISFSGIFSN